MNLSICATKLELTFNEDIRMRMNCMKINIDTNNYHEMQKTTSRNKGENITNNWEV